AHRLFDWNPAKRCDVPEHVPDVPAGVPAPVRWTPWKAGALRVLALLKTQGYITTKQIAAQGISPSFWTQSWLARAAERGQWVATDKTPWHHCDRHPVEYAAALAKVTAGEVVA
ncbi:type IV toxin-antitoxin system AbiEi family antitoxin domain-containing protein, partial [Xanthomonas perforans]|uniref:type IV toxin-antitoxin system AbiEi family antitoxin domain-containing protein n=1 Tax=Xanthomonas perforans TaxID=442694 RepID=UPI001F375B75